MRQLVLGWQALLRRSPTPGSCHGPVDRWASRGLAQLTRVAVNSGWTRRAVAGTLGPVAGFKVGLERHQECILNNYFGLCMHLLL